MILHDHQRRWLELRLYYFCMDLYEIRKDVRDAIFAIEAISQIGGFDLKAVKVIAAKMLGDPYYLPRDDELIILAAMNDVKAKTIAEYTGKHINTIRKMVKERTEKYIILPLLSVEEDQKIKEFLDRLEIFKKAGI